MRSSSRVTLALLLACAVGTPAHAQRSQSATAAAALGRGEVRLTYLGNAGWEITDGRTIVLVDPFLTQFARWTRTGPAPDIAPGALYPADTALIDAHVQRADFILITHGHPDHALDAGYISRRTGAVIIGHETAANLARAYDVPDSSLITVIGGEDYEFGDFSLRVIPNIHSALDHKHYYNNTRGIVGTAPRGLRAPLRRKDYVEGGNLAYLLRIGGHEILIMGSMNFIEREMEGLRPDIALVGANSQRLEIRDYTGRLLRALGQPAIVIPSHADGYGDPNPSAAALADRRRFQQEVAAASPSSRFISPTWFEPIVIPAVASPAAADAAAADAAAPGRQVVNPPGIAPLVPAYSEAVRRGSRVFVSGMTGIKPGTQDIVEGGIAAQTRQTLENIRTVLQATGATMADVDECTVFLRDMADYAAMNAVYMEFFRVDPPARATLAVSALPRPAARVEIKCSAESPQRIREPRSFDRELLLETTSGTSASVSVGDVDGDGTPDVVLAKGRHWPLDNLILRNDGKGHFTTAKLANTPDRTYSAALADLDGDGDPDLVVSNDRPDEKRVYLNDGRGTFRVSGTFGEPTWSTRYVTVADLNGDQRPDLVVANRSSNPAAPRPSFVCLNDGHGAFPACEALATQSATIIVAADLDGDGATDLFVPHRDGGQSLVFWNDGSGRFAAAGMPVLASGSHIRAAVAADIDGDGMMDLVIGDEQHGLFIAEGAGRRTFAPPVAFGTEAGAPYSIGVADLDRDGRADIVVGRQEAVGSVFFNEGGKGPAFSETPWNDGKGSVYGLAIADLDGDGWLDIAAARSDAPNGIWFSGPAAGPGPTGQAHRIP
jgi:reactive intermediate/imine deaminase